MAGSKVYEGIRYPSIDSLLNVVDSKYKLVLISTKVAEMLNSENLDVKDSRCQKNVGKALELVLKGAIQIEFEKVDYTEK
jgi:DNA-directed RNA polymerase subunit omega